MLKLNLQYFGPLVGRADSLENILMEAKSQLIGKDPDAGKDEGRRRRGKPRTRWLDGITDSMDMSPLRSSVYSCYLFLTSSASVRSILFLSFIVPIFG